MNSEEPLPSLSVAAGGRSWSASCDIRLGDLVVTRFVELEHLLFLSHIGSGAFDFRQGDTSGNSTLWKIVRGFIKNPSREQIHCQAPKPILLDTGEIHDPYAWWVNLMFVYSLLKILHLQLLSGCSLEVYRWHILLESFSIICIKYTGIFLFQSLKNVVTV